MTAAAGASATTAVAAGKDDDDDDGFVDSDNERVDGSTTTTASRLGGTSSVSTTTTTTSHSAATTSVGAVAPNGSTAVALGSNSRIRTGVLRMLACLRLVLLMSCARRSDTALSAARVIVDTALKSESFRALELLLDTFVHLSSSVFVFVVRSHCKCVPFFGEMIRSFGHAPHNKHKRLTFVSGVDGARELVVADGATMSIEKWIESTHLALARFDE